MEEKKIKINDEHYVHFYLQEKQLTSSESPPDMNKAAEEFAKL